MPSDLDFFIDYELNDQERRRQFASSEQAARRRVPDANMYKQHQVNNGSISPDSIGGLYTPYYLAPGGQNVPTFNTPRPWHGAPLASLRRAFLLLGSARAQQIDRNQLQKLWRLKELYFTDGTAEAADSPVASPSTPKRPAENVEIGGSQAKRPRAQFNQPGNSEGIDIDTVFTTTTEGNLSAHNLFNPSFTAADFISRFTSSLRHSPTV
jgi:hypothetical protein